METPNPASSKMNPEQALQELFGFDAFRLGQDRVIEAILEKRDTLVVMPTGGGKSLCFQLPALLSGAAAPLSRVRSQQPKRETRRKPPVARS